MMAASTSSRITAIREFSTIEEGFSACNEAVATAATAGHLHHHSFPFIVRQCVSFSEKDSLSISSLRSQLRLEKVVKGYSANKGYSSTVDSHNTAAISTSAVSESSPTTIVHSSSGRAALEAWDRSELLFNVVDSPSSRGYKQFLPTFLEVQNREVSLEDDMWLSYVLSPVNLSCGQLHIDPPFGSNWQYLLEGVKTWFVVTDEEFCLKEYNIEQRILQDEHERIQKDNDLLPLFLTDINSRCTVPDMQDISTRFSVSSATIGPGDFISCPSCSAHSIITQQASLGISGYTATPEALNLVHHHSSEADVPVISVLCDY